MIANSVNSACEIFSQAINNEQNHFSIYRLADRVTGRNRLCECEEQKEGMSGDGGPRRGRRLRAGRSRKGREEEGGTGVCRRVWEEKHLPPPPALRAIALFVDSQGMVESHIMIQIMIHKTEHFIQSLKPNPNTIQNLHKIQVLKYKSIFEEWKNLTS